jgi:hypothetical protein
MRVHLVNPSHVSFGVGVITPRWMCVMATATPAKYGDPILADETLAALDVAIRAGDVDRPATFDATAALAERAGLTFAQFVMLTSFPGTLDFGAWEKTMAEDSTRIAGMPVTRHWLIPQAARPKVYVPHP